MILNFYDMKQTLLFVALLLLPLSIKAQYSLIGRITDAKDGTPIVGAQVLLMTNGNMTTFAIADSTGCYKLKNIVNGTYDVNVSCIGYKEYNGSMKITADNSLDIKLTEDASVLDSVTVTGSRLRKTTTFGHIYYLSDKAKKSGDPYKALQEIPEITSDYVMQKVESIDKEKMLILVDGVLVNSGITPIDPKRIESVEVMDVVSPKYLNSGAKKILNIRLKQQKERYVFFQTGFNNFYPVYSTTAWVTSEVGNSKLSFYYSVNATSMHDYVSSYKSNVSTSYYNKSSSGNSLTQKKAISYAAMLKYVPSAKDYLSVYFQGYNGTQKIDSHNWGTFVSDTDMETSDNGYASYGWLHNLYRVFSGTMFYRHKFSNKAEMENYILGTYNYNGRRNNGIESYPKNSWEDKSDFRTERKSFKWTWDYTLEISKNATFTLTNNLNFISDHLKENYGSLPLYKHREWNDYFHPGISGKIGKIRGSVSVGITGVWRWSAGVFDRYFRPYSLVYANYQVNNYGTLTAYYGANSAAPSVEKLNPYNTSTDSLYRTVGNPYLKPQNTQFWQLMYSYYKKGFYISLNTVYNTIKDRFESVGYTSEDGVYTQTYGNLGRERNVSVNLMSSYSFKNTRLYVQLGNITFYYPGQSHHNSFSFTAQWSQTIAEKWGLTLQFDYTNYSYTAISQTRNLCPSGAFHISYNFNPNLMIALGSYCIYGNPKTETKIYVNGYDAYTQTKTREFHPYISLRWTMRKNDKKKIKLDNSIMRRQEDAINL